MVNTSVTAPVVGAAPSSASLFSSSSTKTDYGRILKKGERKRGAAGLRSLKKSHDCENGGEGSISTSFTCSIAGKTIVTRSDSRVGLWRFEGNSTVFTSDKFSTGSGSLRLSSSPETDTTTATVAKAWVLLPRDIPVDGLTTVSYDYSSVNDTTPTIRVGVFVKKKNKSNKRQLHILSKNKSNKKSKSRKCYFDYSPTITTKTNDWVTFSLTDFTTTVKEETSTKSSDCPNTLAEVMKTSPSLFKSSRLVSLGLVLLTDTNINTTGYLDNIMLSFKSKDKAGDVTASDYTFDLEPAVNTRVDGRANPVSKFASFKTGWLVNDPSKRRNISFSKEEFSTGKGSLKVGPLQAGENVVVSYNMKRMMGSPSTARVLTVEYDYFVKKGGSSSAADDDPAHFTLSLYASMPKDEESDAVGAGGTKSMKSKNKRKYYTSFPKPKSFDCRFDYAADGNTAGAGAWSTVTVDASTTASVSFGKDDNDNCPGAFGDMPTGSVLGLMSIEVGNNTIPENVAGISGYLDNVVLTMKNGEYVASDFEVKCGKINKDTC